MLYIIGRLIEICAFICLFKAKPQNLPSSYILVAASSFVVFIAFVMRNVRLPYDNPLIAAAVQVALLTLTLKILLHIFSKPERWDQAATALFGCSAVLAAITVPFLWSTTADMAIGILTLADVVMIISGAWHFTMIYVILRETLETGSQFTLLITVVAKLAYNFILLHLFGIAL